MLTANLSLCFEPSIPRVNLRFFALSPQNTALTSLSLNLSEEENFIFLNLVTKS